MDTVSVVIPTYNDGAFLREAVESAIRQTVPPSEIIVVDDGSTDRTADTCSEFPSLVRYVRQSNAGVTVARNRGVREASGRWIAFLDGDDVWESNKLEVQLATLHSLPGIRWTCSDCGVMAQSGELVAASGLELVCSELFREVGMPVRAFLSQALLAHEIEASGQKFQAYAGDIFGLLFYGNVVLPPSVVMDRQLFLDLRGFDETLRCAEETEFFHRVSAYAPVAFVSLPLLRVRRGRSGSLSSSSNAIQLAQNALESSRRAAALRRPLGPFELAAFRAGRQRFRERLAYYFLSAYDGRHAREQIRESWNEGAAPSLRGLVLFVVGLLPGMILRVIHRAKRSIM